MRKAVKSNSAGVIALLRGVNVGGNKKIPMSDLRALATACGYQGVATYIQSGNVVFTAQATPAEVELALEKALEKKLGFSVEVIARTAAQWARYVKSNPFLDVPEERLKFVHLLLSKSTPKADAVDVLRSKATFNERIERAGDALWVDFTNGAGNSKLSPAVMDKAVGSTVTARNFRTVLELADMARALA